MLTALVERHGYRAIAIESDCVAATVVDDYVTTGTGDLEKVLETGSVTASAPPANRELVTWIRDHNAGHNPNQHVRFYGFDAPWETFTPGPTAVLMAAHTYLATHLRADRLPHDARTLNDPLGHDADWTNPAAMREDSQSSGHTPRARSLRLRPQRPPPTTPILLGTRRHGSALVERGGDRRIRTRRPLHLHRFRLHRHHELGKSSSDPNSLQAVRTAATSERALFPSHELAAAPARHPRIARTISADLGYSPPTHRTRRHRCRRVHQGHANPKDAVMRHPNDCPMGEHYWPTV